MRYAPTTGYVRFFKIPMQFPNRVRATLRKTVPFSSPLGAPVGRIRYAPTTWVRTILRNTDAIPQPDTYGPSKNYPVFVPFGAAYEAYSIRPYDWVRAILQNTDAIPRPGMCGPSKNCPVFVPFGAVCGAYAIRPYDRVRAALQKMIPSLSPSGPLVGRMQYAPTTGYVRSFEILTQCPNRVCAILRNTDAIPQPDTCNPSKYRYDLSSGGEGAFGRWGGRDYRLRERRA